MFFTLLVISLLFLFLITYTFYSNVQDRKAIQERIETMNNFVFSLEKDLPRQLYTSGFRVLFLLERRITETGEYITDLEDVFSEVFYNATIYGETNDEIQQMMNGVTYSGILESTNQKADKINLKVNLTDPLLVISQDNPWSVKLNLTADLLIEDKSNLALWNLTSYSIVTYISIENFEDPLYIVETSGYVSNKFNKTIYNVPVSIDDLPSHSQNSYYINSTLAPSFLDRLQGIKTANENGIESLVYLPELSAQGVSVKDKSCVDYIYFSSQNPPSQNIGGMPDWFKIDDEHLGLYGI